MRAVQVRFESALWWEVCVIATMIFNPTVQRSSCTRGHRGLEPVPAITGRRRGTPCTSHQFNTGLTQRDKQECSHLWTSCVKGSQSIWRVPIRPQGEQVHTQKSDSESNLRPSCCASHGIKLPPKIVIFSIWQKEFQHLPTRILNSRWSAFHSVFDVCYSMVTRGTLHPLNSVHTHRYTHTHLKEYSKKKKK